MPFDTEHFSGILQGISRQVNLSKTIKREDIKTIAAFDCANVDRTLVCAVVVVDAETLEVLEKKTLIKPSPAPYIPGYVAFREGPLILELYYSLEHEPDILMLDGEGICHPDGAGLACYVGTELAKPAIGVMQDVFVGDKQGDDVIVDGKIAARKIVTKQYARPLYISPGNKVSVDVAAPLCLSLVRPPHKLPEPLHIAHRIADRTADRVRSGELKLEAEPKAADVEEMLEDSIQPRIEG
jgi:deoxyribonuclease V